MGAYIEIKHFNYDAGMLATLTRSLTSDHKKIVLEKAIAEAEGLVSLEMNYFLDLSEVVESELSTQLQSKLALFRNALADIVIWVLFKNSDITFSEEILNKAIQTKDSALSIIARLAVDKDFKDEFADETDEVAEPMSMTGKILRA